MEYTGLRTDLKKMVIVRVQAINELKVLPNDRTLSHLLKEVKDQGKDREIRKTCNLVDIRTSDQVVVKATQIKWQDMGLTVATLQHNLSSVRMPCLVVVL